jgi:allophanate hydrolase subunit 2
MCADEILGSQSTYLPAGIGGYAGRILQNKDEVPMAKPRQCKEELVTPEEFRLPMVSAWTIRAGRSFESDSLLCAEKLFSSRFRIGARSDRMGIKLEGERFDVRSGGRMPSAPVFPGTVQCPEEGTPYLLSVDAQTTGGYPRVAMVARMDRHLIGQLRSGDKLGFLARTPEESALELHDKLDYWRRWLPEINTVI